MESAQEEADEILAQLNVGFQLHGRGYLARVTVTLGLVSLEESVWAAEVCEHELVQEREQGMLRKEVSSENSWKVSMVGKEHRWDAVGIVILDEGDCHIILASLLQ